MNPLFLFLTHTHTTYRGVCHEINAFIAYHYKNTEKHKKLAEAFYMAMEKNMKHYNIEFGFTPEQRVTSIELFRLLNINLELCDAMKLANKWNQSADSEKPWRKKIKLNEKQFLIFAEFMLTRPEYNKDAYVKIVRIYDNDDDNITVDFTQ